MQRPQEITRLLWSHLRIVPVRLWSIWQRIRKRHDGQRVTLKAKSGITVDQPGPGREGQAYRMDLRKALQRKGIDSAHLVNSTVHNKCCSACRFVDKWIAGWARDRALLQQEPNGTMPLTEGTPNLMQR